VDPHYGGPEYETIAALGSDCGIDDLKLIAKGNEMVNAYGLDSISCGANIAFAMECFENGLLTKDKPGGLELSFGNGQAMLQMIEQIALRQSLGGVLAEGVARAAKKIGVGADKFAHHIKGLELPMHEPRFKQGLGVGYSMSPTGADHCHNMHDSMYSASSSSLFQEMKAVGILQPLPVNDLSPAKIRLLVYSSLWMHFMNCATCCFFVMFLSLVGFERVAQLVTSVTGWNTSVFELMKVGERAANLARVFNFREGLTADDDNMPQLFFTPQASGPLQGVVLDSDAFQKAKESYYDMMGWPAGLPSIGKLEELGIDWAIPMK
ncbi:MAG: aldehyde ferredoxin oxidoreductase C-terminal domain-containing protein, partial [Candidatus Thorarchaeota archaeon]